MSQKKDSQVIEQNKHCACKKASIRTFRGWSGIFLSIFLQPGNGSESWILNWVMKLHLFMCLFFFFVFETLLKDFPFYSPTLLNLWFRYLQTRVKESFMFLSSQLFFKTTPKTLKFQGKSKKNAFSSVLQT